MALRSLTILQTLLDGNHPLLNQPIPIYTISDADLGSSDILSVFNHSRALGVSPGYLPSGKLVSLAIADDKNCRVVEFQQLDANSFKRNRTSGKASEKSLEGRILLQDKILCRTTGDIFAFDMAALTMSLYSDLNLRITQAVDVQSAFPDVRDRTPLLIVKDALKDSEGIKKINEENLKHLFLKPVHEPQDNPRDRITDLAMRAWLSQFLPTFGDGETTFAAVPRIDTKKLMSGRLDMLSKLVTDSLKLDSKKPTQTTHQIAQTIDPTTGGLVLNSQNYHNKLRDNRELKINVVGPRGEFTVNAEVAAVSGRAGSINTGNRMLTNKDVMTVTSVGRDAQTSAEAKRALALLRALQGVDKSFDESPWIQNIWYPAKNGVLVWPKEWTPTQPIKSPPLAPSPAISRTMSALPKLNPSQQTSVNSMLAETDNHRITIIQGPPGTGKTSVIASFVHFSVNLLQRGGIWLVAQSNVAVKNIAEKLIATNFTAWKLVVSKDFHFDWHEHLYGKVEDHIIRSDGISEATGRAKLRGTHVILCTLSMLSNKLMNKFLFQIPFKTLVVDEASQIEIGDYIPVFSNFKTLRKICFIGDDKQLPPFGQEDIGNLKSIFEVSHFNHHILFLDTQYRMPPQIGRVISKAVYNDQLKSNPLHPITDKFTACYFIDANGKEEPSQGGSFKNKNECMAVLDLAEKLQDKEKNYRIITPYAHQTAYIEQSMKDRGLIWADKCFNVDSFQGNEEDFIIISVVRSRGLGFLANLRRTNVMLSRCKKGMFIISSKEFLTGIGADTLVGQFLKDMAPATWLDYADIQAGNFLDF